MGGPDLARDPRFVVRSRPRVPLFGGPVPEQAKGVERAINLARVVGVVLLTIGLLTGQARSPLAVLLTALIALQSAYVARALRGPRRWSPTARAVSSALDVLAVGIALFMAGDREPWTHAAAPLLSVVVVGFRSGRGGALLAAVASSALLILAGSYREAAFGISTTAGTYGSWMTLYFLTALLMSGALREMDLLRERQRQQNERDSALLDAQSDLGEMLLVTDGDHVLEMNDAVRRLTGRSAAEAGGLRLNELFAPEDAVLMRARADAGGPQRTEATMRGRDGQPRAVEVAIKAVRRDAGRYIAVAHDITDRKRIEGELARRSLYDALTKLPNRTLLSDRLLQAIATAADARASVSVLMLDVASFRQVNDTLGFAAGDDLLRALATRLGQMLRPSETVARVGGDEFAMVLADGDERTVAVVSALSASLRRPFSLGGADITIDVAIGVAHHPEHGGDPATLLQHAEFAMYEAKLSGSLVAVYALERGATAPSQLVVAEMQRAIEQEELLLHYQPQVSMADGALVGVEALVRWRHPRLGLLPPSDFVPLIERTALGRAFTDHVMLRALRDRSSWREDLRSTALAVNVSGRDLLDRALPGDVRTFVGDVTPTSSLKLEVTESVLSADPALIERTASELHALGIGLSIDDFGTGGSSLTHLARLPVSEVKIDRSFVSMMRTDARRRAIVRSTIELAHALGSRVVAEGVEDRETWDLLADMGCDAAQGYLVARPMPPEALIAWVGSRSAAVN